MLKLIGTLSPKRQQRGQRILFLSGFSTACIKEGILDKGTLKTLNRSLKITDNEESLDMGAQLCGELFPKGHLTKILNADEPIIHPTRDGLGREYATLTEAKIATGKILENTPPWLKYNPSEMEGDIMDLLCNNRINCG